MKSAQLAFFLSSTAAILFWTAAWFWKFEALFIAASPFFIWAALAFTVLALAEDRPTFEPGELLTSGALGLALTAFIFLFQDTQFRILDDETRLLATSRSLYHFHGLQVLEQYLSTPGSEQLIETYPAHRPGLFAVLVSFLHFIFGYSPFHGFALNFAVSTLSLAAFYLAGLRLKNRMTGILAALFLAAFPIYQLNVTSSGFDALNMLMLFLAYAQIIKFMLDPTPKGFELMALTALLAALCRYESAAVALPVALAALYHRKTLLQAQGYSNRLALIPLLYLPVIWQKLVSNNFANPGDPAEKAFELSYTYFSENLLSLFYFFSDFLFLGFPTNQFVFVLALVGLAVFYRRAMPVMRLRHGAAFARRFRDGLLFVLLSHVLITAAQLCYQFGNILLPWVNRFAQVQLIWIPLLAALALSSAWPKLDAPRRRLAPLLLAAVFVYGLHQTRVDASQGLIIHYRAYQDAREYMPAHFPPETTLVISGQPNTYTALGYSAIGYDTAQDKLPELIEGGWFRHIIAVEYTEKLYGRNDLAAYSMRELWTKRITALHYYTLFEVI